MLPRFIFSVERWKWNAEYQVWVSTEGHFADEHKKPIPIRISRDGYCGIITRYGYRSAHRLVMMTWVPTNDQENLTVDHKNHNKRDNSLRNLEWVTKEENQKRAVEDFFAENLEEDSNVFTKNTIVFVNDVKMTMRQATTLISGCPVVNGATKSELFEKISKNLQRKKSCKLYGFTIHR